VTVALRACVAERRTFGYHNPQGHVLLQRNVLALH